MFAQHGLLAEDDPTELAKAIGRILDEPPLAALLQRNARISVMDYDWGHLVRERILPLYAHYMAANGARS